MKFQTFGLALLLALGANACKKGAQKDYDRICDLTGLYIADRGADQEARYARWASELGAISWSDAGTKNVLQAMAVAAPEAKYSIVKQGANEQGLGENWECPALRDWLDEVAKRSAATAPSGSLEAGQSR